MNVTFQLPVNVGRFPKGTLTVEGVYNKNDRFEFSAIYYQPEKIKSQCWMNGQLITYPPVDIYDVISQYAPMALEDIEHLAIEHAEAMMEKSDFSHSNDEL